MNIGVALLDSVSSLYSTRQKEKLFPTSVIIDKQGIVRLFTHPANKDKIIALIEELLAE